MLTDTVIERLQPWTKWDASHHRVSQGLVVGHQFDETETTTQGSIQQGDGAIRRVHRADDRDILGISPRLISSIMRKNFSFGNCRASLQNALKMPLRSTNCIWPLTSAGRKP